MRRWARHQVNEKTSESNAVRVVVPKKPKKKGIRRFVDVFIPHGGDPVLEIVRKSVFAVALMVLVGSLGYLGYELVYAPISNGNRYTTLVDDYTPDNPAPYPPGDYPAGMDDALKLLYSKNSDLRGWITYKSNFANDFLKINYPIVYSGDNDYYLHHDFYKAANAYGCLFFDKNNKLNSPADMNKALIIYGHDMVNGQMFAGLNKLIFNLANARSAPVITMNTLYEKGEYKVFSVMVLTGDVNQEAFFNAWRTSFSSGDFTQFVADVRARSMYDYSQVVDVGSDDQLLILSTCTVKSTVGFDNGRLVVVARKVRPGESDTVNTAKITDNKDVIMPLTWYTSRNLAPHPYYTNGQLPTYDDSGAAAANATTATVPGQTGAQTTASPPDTTTPPADTTAGTTAKTTTKPSATTTDTQPSDTESITEPPTEPPTETATEPPTEPSTTEATEPVG